MKPIVSIIMGSTSDLPVMEKAMKWLEDQEIPFEVNALSAHRTPDAVEEFAKTLRAVASRLSLPELVWLLHCQALLLRLHHCR